MVTTPRWAMSITAGIKKNRRKKKKGSQKKSAKKNKKNKKKKKEKTQKTRKKREKRKHKKNDNRGYNNRGNDEWRNRQYRGRNWGQYGNYGGNSNFRQTALNAGYNEGISQGRRDRNRGPRDLNDFSQYRNASKDYNSREGDLGLYQRYYREGFENGYYDGLRGY